MSEGQRRRRVEEALSHLGAMNVAYQADESEVNGRALLAAREAASHALAALWEACPAEKPPTQAVI